MWPRVQGVVLGREFGLHFRSFKFQIKLKCLVGELEMIFCQQS